MTTQVMPQVGSPERTGQPCPGPTEGGPERTWVRIAAVLGIAALVVAIGAGALFVRRGRELADQVERAEQRVAAARAETEVAAAPETETRPEVTEVASRDGGSGDAGGGSASAGGGTSGGGDDPPPPGDDPPEATERPEGPDSPDASGLFIGFPDEARAGDGCWEIKVDWAVYYQGVEAHEVADTLGMTGFEGDWICTNDAVDEDWVPVDPWAHVELFDSAGDMFESDSNTWVLDRVMNVHMGAPYYWFVLDQGTVVSIVEQWNW